MRLDTEPLFNAGNVFSLAGGLYLLIAGLACIHVLLNKQNVSSALSWIGVIILSPFFGAILYWLFGINRIRRRSRAQMREVLGNENVGNTAKLKKPLHGLPTLTTSQLQLYKTGLSLHNAPFLSGNQIDILINGTAAFPEMLNAIRRASSSVVLSSYIFEYDAIGQQFVDALVAAHERGVSVRVLIDGVGIGYGLGKSDRVLRRSNVITARFLPTFSTSGTRFINMRNHRKILSVDGTQVFVGGMNIRAGNMNERLSKHRMQDLHFKLRGPALDQINKVFEDNWLFATGEALTLPRWDKGEVGDVMCRALLDGPDDNYKKLELTIIAAINSASKRIVIVTPYFMPDETVVHALHLAVLRDVEVKLLIPDKNNLRFVDWAMKANESKLIKLGIKIYRSEPPFDHSKLFVVDGTWSLVGSSNWDARSLELNFEINVESFDQVLAEKLEKVVADKLEKSFLVKPSRNKLLTRLRNNLFRLFTPYF